MPIHKVKVGKKEGFQWGEKGKKYTGSDAKKKAGKQAAAAFANGYKGKH